MTGSLLPLLVVLLGTGWSFFIHANLRWRLGPVEWLVSTPAFHHWHHNRTDPVDRNFASLLPVFDWVFGTLHLPRRAWPVRYGIMEPTPASLGRRLLDPLLPARPVAKRGDASTSPSSPA